MKITRNDLKNVLKVYNEKIKELLNNKVDKVSGKGLSTNDYTTTEKNKLAGIDANANNYTHPSTHPASIISGLSTVATSGSYNDLLNKPSTFPPSSHDHDDIYYTETEINSLLNGKANSSHDHTKSQISDFPSSLPANGGNADTVGGKGPYEFVQMPSIKLSVDNLKNANYPYSYRTSLSDGTQIGLPIADWYHIDYFRHLDNNGFGYQVAYPLNHGGTICARWSSGTNWQTWVQLYDSGHKPTPAEIGALPITGGDCTGAIGTNYNDKRMVMGTGADDTYLWNSKSGAYLQMKDSGELHYNSNIVYHAGRKPTITEIGAASAGYGLGTACAIPSGNDWNNALKTGFYMGSVQANAPNTDWWMGFALNHHDGWVVQKVCNFNSSQQWMTRYKLNGTWTAWTNEYDRKITQSTSGPSGGSNGDIWIQY